MTRERIRRIHEARMVRRFCNGAVALGIALTACAAFPRAVMAIDLSRFYGHSNTKRSGKSTTTGGTRAARRERRKLVNAPSFRRVVDETLSARIFLIVRHAETAKRSRGEKSRKNKIARTIRSFYKRHCAKFFGESAKNCTRERMLQEHYNLNETFISNVSIIFSISLISFNIYKTFIC